MTEKRIRSGKGRASRAPVRHHITLGSMTAPRFAAFMERMGWDTLQAANSLGLKRRVIYLYLSGERPIPRIVELLCEAYDFGWKPRSKT